MDNRPGSGRPDPATWRLGRLNDQFVATRHVDGRRERHRLGADRGTAERAIARLNAPPAEAGTVAELWRDYVAENEGKAVLVTMAYSWKALAPTFAALEPDTITTAHCREHMARRRSRNGTGDGTLHTELGHLRTVLNWAVKRRRLAHAPHVERPPKPAPRDHYLTREEVRRLIDAAELPHVRLALVLAISTSARIGALLDLTWDRVDFARGRILLANPDDPVRRKARAIVPMNDTARAALEEAKGAAITDHVIEYAGRPVASIKRGIATAARRAGLAATPHVLRHSAAVWMAEAGIADRQIAEYLGHSNVAMVQRVYARFRPEHLVDAAAVLELDGPSRRPQINRALAG